MKSSHRHLIFKRRKFYRAHRSSVVSIAIVVSFCLGGCGAGYLGDDDIQPGACAVGTAPPFVPQVLPSRDSTERIRILLFRGLQNDYSLGLDLLADQLRTLNFNPWVVGWPGWMEAAQSIAMEHSALADGTEYMFIGHSYGADHAIRAARYLRDYGIRVKMLYLLDTTVPDPIPDNVDYCIHYYYPWLPGFLAPWFFSGNPVVAEAGNTQTEISNLLFTRATIGDAIGCANHFSIDANQYMHNRVVETALQLMEE